MEFLTANWNATLETLVVGTTASAFIISPFVNSVALDVFGDLRRHNVPCRLLTRLNPADILKGVTRGEVLRELIRLGVDIKTRHGLHAKAYFFDRRVGVVTSANLTRGGVSGNYEMGVQFTDGECPAAFQEADRWWGESQKTLTIEDIEGVLQEVKDYRERHPGETAELPEELADRSEIPSDAEAPAMIRLKRGVVRGNVEARLPAFRGAYQHIDFQTRVDRLGRDLSASHYGSIPLQTYLWLAGWCNTGSKKRTAMERARELATELFAYIPPEFLEIAGRRYGLKEYRYDRPVPFADEIVAMHLERMSDAARSR